jgi:hypothetical protein
MKHLGLFAIVVVSFAAGFAVHALYVPYLFVDGNTVSAKEELARIAGERRPGEDSDFITYVGYKDGRFSPSRVTIKQGDYLAITNNDTDERMYLSSDNRQLVTPRDYGESERLQVAVVDTGTFTVTNRLKPSAKLTVQVK